MDASSFEAAAPGELVELGYGEFAFVPEPLPPMWQWPAALWPLLVRAKEQLARLDGMTKNLPDPGIFVRPLQQREAMRSSSLEGTYASPRELLLFDLKPDASTAERPEANAWREVYNYNKALRHGAATVAERGLLFSLIPELHKILLTGVRGRDRTPGQFRNDQVFIGVNHRFAPPPVTHLRICLDQLRAYLSAPTGEHDPLIRCFLVHYQFETIHPFSDGNGRVGRLLLSLMIQAWCEASGPWLYLSAFFDQHKDEYIDSLFAVSARAA
jgi:Fic family protein